MCRSRTPQARSDAPLRCAVAGDLREDTRVRGCVINDVNAI